ncbi:hypothetical protein NQ317_014647 [Molorchus minor]|uniref:Ornithine decarboxylase antizyme n=1 Tax=Molorchus minor TaxID=1323400 RepID=A0ABQ9JS00_9CUCU|nr:hypothetical protein NQ317_014647 [Molorchus minor]
MYVLSVRRPALPRPIATTCLWAPGLCGGPDAPGEARGAPLQRLTFRTARQPWDAVLRGRTLYIALPPHVLPEGSREAFVALLEAAEEQLKCQHVIVHVLQKKVPFHDLQFCKELMKYKTIDASISKAACGKIKNHLWYLNPENVSLSFFDENILIDDKKEVIITMETSGSANEISELSCFHGNYLPDKFTRRFSPATAPDRAVLVRTFMFLGFAVLSPTSPLVPPQLAQGNVCMLYNIEVIYPQRSLGCPIFVRFSSSLYFICIFYK